MTILWRFLTNSVKPMSTDCRLHPFLQFCSEKLPTHIVRTYPSDLCRLCPLHREVRQSRILEGSPADVVVVNPRQKLSGRHCSAPLWHMAYFIIIWFRMFGGNSDRFDIILDLTGGVPDQICSISDHIGSFQTWLRKVFVSADTHWQCPTVEFISSWITLTKKIFFLYCS